MDLSHVTVSELELSNAHEAVDWKDINTAAPWQEKLTANFKIVDLKNLGFRSNVYIENVALGLLVAGICLSTRSSVLSL